MSFDIICYYQECYGTGTFIMWGLGKGTFDDTSTSLFPPSCVCQPVMPMLTHGIWDLKSHNKLSADCAIMPDDHLDAWDLMGLTPHWADSSLLSGTSLLPFEEYLVMDMNLAEPLTKRLPGLWRHWQTERKCTWVPCICQCLLFKVGYWEIYKMKGSEKDTLPCWLCLLDFRRSKRKKEEYVILQVIKDSSGNKEHLVLLIVLRTKGEG